MKIPKIKEEAFLRSTSKFTLLIGLFILGYFSIRIWISGFTIAGNLTKEGLEISSWIGDYLGGVVGAFWTLTGVLLFYRALGLQREELNNQIKELKATREVFREQQFENTFFNLIRTQQEITSQIETTISKKGRNEIFRGRMLLGEIIPDFINHFDSSEEISDATQRIKVSYKKFFDYFHPFLSHYFRHLYHILLFLSTEELKEMDEISKSSNFNNEKSKQIRKDYLRYAGFIQAQMSSQELFLLFYNSVCYDEMRKLVVKYNLLENLAREDLILPDVHEKLYPEINFKSREYITN